MQRPIPGDRPIYLDHNATTPVRPEVVEAMLPWLRDHFGNPSSEHPYGWTARDAVAQARGEVAALIGCHPSEIVFTAGGTEANNLAIHGVVRPGDPVVTSAVEHPAIFGPLSQFPRLRLDVVPVDGAGRVEVSEVLARVRPDTRLITVMLGNNETGTIMPVEGWTRRGALVHTDAAQAVGKLAVDVDTLGVDLLTIAGHKLGAPKGIGALYVRTGTPLVPLLQGASHEAGRRPGTENVAGIVALGEACRLARLELPHRTARLTALRDRLHRRLQAIEGLGLNGHPEHRLPNTLNVRFPGVRGAEVLERAPQVAASTGSACHAGSYRPSPVLTAMGLPPDDALGAVRLSVGHETTDDDVDRAADALIEAWRSLRGTP